jgi:hypothetical protein
MTLDQFWNIIGEVHRDAGGKMDEKCEFLTGIGPALSEAVP